MPQAALLIHYSKFPLAELLYLSTLDICYRDIAGAKSRGGQAGVDK
jgi:hypothetical protein